MKSFKVFVTMMFSILLFLSVTHASQSGQNIILTEVNAYRIKHGLSPLKLNESLSREAENHSHRMAENIIPFSHDEFKERKQRIREKFSDTYAIAENVAYNDLGLQGIVEHWLSSRPHRKNIEGHYRLTGIGIAKTPRGRVYVTQIFLN